MENNKKELGQFFTKTNIFNNRIFRTWFEKVNTGVMLEPFAGDNAIPKMINDIYKGVSFVSFDIDPKADGIKQNDSILNMPFGYKTCITNPPYLSKVMAKRHKIEYNSEYPDLYLECLNRILYNCENVAIIIPTTFVINKLMKERLCKVIILEEKMFNDTETPVCLCLFNKEYTNDFDVYINEEYIDTMDNIRNKHNNTLECDHNTKMNFNDVNGTIGIKCLDGATTDLIEFVEAVHIDKNKITHSSRSNTIVKIESPLDPIMVINESNKILNDYREITSSILLNTFRSFNGLGKHRKRLDFKTARLIINKAINNIEQT